MRAGHGRAVVQSCPPLQIPTWGGSELLLSDFFVALLTSHINLPNNLAVGILGPRMSTPLAEAPVSVPLRRVVAVLRISRKVVL